MAANIGTWCSASPRSAGSVEHASSDARSTAAAAAPAPLLLHPAAIAPIQARPTETLPPPRVCSSALRSKTCKRSVLSSGDRPVRPAGADHCNCALLLGCRNTHLSGWHHTHVRPHSKSPQPASFELSSDTGHIGFDWRQQEGPEHCPEGLMERIAQSSAQVAPAVPSVPMWRGLLRWHRIAAVTPCKFQAFWVAC